MNTIKFNNSIYEVVSFNKSTYFNEGGINSSANCSIKTANMTSLYALAESGLQSIQIYHDNELIYDLDNINGKMTSIDEYLMDDHININVNLTFVFENAEESEVQEPEI